MALRRTGHRMWGAQPRPRDAPGVRAAWVGLRDRRLREPLRDVPDGAGVLLRRVPPVVLVVLLRVSGLWGRSGVRYHELRDVFGRAGMRRGRLSDPGGDVLDHRLGRLQPHRVGDVLPAPERRRDDLLDLPVGPVFLQSALRHGRGLRPLLRQHEHLVLRAPQRRPARLRAAVAAHHDHHTEG